MLNYWDESLASCAAPQETRLIEEGEENGRVMEQRVKVYGRGEEEVRRTQGRRGRREEQEEEFEYGYRPTSKRRR